MSLIQISIHAPREGCDGVGRKLHRVIRQFQSTHPVRGATTPPLNRSHSAIFQSTHPVRGATMVVMLPSALVPDFNPRTP